MAPKTPEWAAAAVDKVVQALMHYADQVQQGDPIYVTLALFVAFFAVVGVSYLQYRKPPAAVQKRAGGKSRPRKKKPASGSNGPLCASSEETASAGDGDSQKPGKPKRRGNKGSAAVESAPGVEAQESGDQANEPLDRDGEGEWQVVTNKKKRKQK
ncbi:UNVERIFIED_CONTAM: hypothetical protein HHA_295630 [Hammondia hammondi]|eukprot:XP_008888153.1 hypothetical protein HHA_295630 [Hammondia hammondi]